MKILNLEARKKFTDLNLHILDSLPGKTISLAATVQYIPILYSVKTHLESNGKKVILKKGPAYEGHVIGCNPAAFSKEADTLLLITDGKFHALNNAIQMEKEIYVFNTHTLEKLSYEEIKKVNMKRQAAIKKFLMADNVGILVSTKPGQNFKSAEKIKEKLEKKGKKAYIFESDNINPSEFENFSLPIYINTACFGLGLDDSRIVNLQDILGFI
jgi:diphthamide biosynthesis enzyme Dph1/Dph2-like protein